LRDALEKIDELRFRSQEEKHELSHLYESKIKNMGNAGRNGGEYYIMPSSFLPNEYHLQLAA
jgi:type I restriction enzyme M protein